MREDEIGHEREIPVKKIKLNEDKDTITKILPTSKFPLIDVHVRPACFFI